MSAEPTQAAQAEIDALDRKPLREQLIDLVKMSVTASKKELREAYLSKLTIEQTVKLTEQTANLARESAQLSRLTKWLIGMTAVLIGLTIVLVGIGWAGLFTDWWGQHSGW
jgi:hypothetical protein